MKQDRYSKLITICILIFVAWLSFVPEPLQHRYSGFWYIFLLLVFSLSLLRNNFNFRSSFFRKGDVFVWLYFIFIAAGLIAAVNKARAWESYTHLVLLSALIYFIIRNEVDNANVDRILFSFVVFSFIVSIIGILEWVFSKNIIYIYLVKSYYYPKFILKKRIISTLENPSILATYLLACLPLVYYFYHTAVRVFKKRIYLIFLTVTASALFLTLSRASIFGGAIILSVYLWQQKKKSWIFIIWGLFFIFSVSVLFIPDILGLRSRFGLTYLISYISKSERTTQYFVTFNMLKAHPFVGIGWGHYRMVFDNYTNLRLPFIIMVPDSSYLMHLAETGIIGFSSFMIFLISLFNKTNRHLANKEKNAAFKFILMGFIGILINMGTYDVFLWYTPVSLFWIYAGMLSGLSLPSDSQEYATGNRNIWRALKKPRLIFAVVSLFLLIATVFFVVFTWPDVSWLRQGNPAETAMMRFNEDAARKSKDKYEIHYQFVPLSRISENLQKSVLIAEDNTFFHHRGFNWRLIKSALLENFRKGKIIRGSSTITQQLARNLFLSPERSLMRKIREVFITIKLEKELSKPRILELYLNVIRWGYDIYGAEAAARAYYQKSASELSIEEAIRLASILPKPQKFTPAEKSPLMSEKRLKIARKLYKIGFIDEKTHQELKQKLTQ